jgi:hypothetical protein
LQVIFNFLCRVSAKQILLIDDDVPVGYINRTPLLLWLRNQWAVTTGRFSEIVHTMQITDLPYKSLKESVGELMKKLALLDKAISKNVQSDDWEINRDQLVALISKSQDIMDNVLKLTSQKNNINTGNLAQLGFG